MGLRNADGVGVSVGQPDRIDQQGEAYQERLRAGVRLEIPKTGIEKPKDQKLDQEGRGQRNSWRAQEEATGNRGRVWQSGQTRNWNSFSNGRNRRSDSRSRGAVVIDAGPTNTSSKVKNQAPVAQTTPNPETERPDGWQSQQFAHFKAAKFEEYNRETVNPFLGKKKTASTRRRGVLVDR